MVEEEVGRMVVKDAAVGSGGGSAGRGGGDRGVGGVARDGRAVGGRRERGVSGA